MEKGSYFPKKLWKVFNICGEILRERAWRGPKLAFALLSLKTWHVTQRIRKWRWYLGSKMETYSVRAFTCPDIYSHNKWRVAMHLFTTSFNCHDSSLPFSLEWHPRACCHNLLTSLGTSMLESKTLKGTETMKFTRRNLNSNWKFIQLAAI